MNLKNKIILGAIMFLLLLATVSAVVGWYRAINRPVLSRTEYLPAPPIIKIKTVPVPGPATIEVIDKTQLIKKIDMPEGFKDDPNKQALATASIPPYEGKTSAVSVLDTKTGAGEILIKQEPLSFAGFINEKELYLKGGYTTSREVEIAGGGRWLFARVGGIKIGGYAEARGQFATDENNSAGSAAAGIILTY